MQTPLPSPRTERILFCLTVLITAAFLFYPPYLPMVDLPQHAGKVAALDDLLKQRSPWAHLVVLNWDTPYLAGCALWLLLYQFTDIVLSSKILMVFIFWFHTYAVFRLRQDFQAAKLLEWVSLPAFFRLRLSMVFLTFLLAAPVGILFFLRCKHWLEGHRRHDFVCLVLLGVAMYFCHVLIFAFFYFLSYGYFLLAHCRNLSWRQRVVFILPYLPYAAMLARYVSKPALWAFRYYEQDFVFVSAEQKMAELLYLPWNMVRIVEFDAAGIALLAFLPLLGLRLRRDVRCYLPLLGFLMIWYALPHIGFQTGFVYQRFTFFSFLFIT